MTGITQQGLKGGFGWSAGNQVISGLEAIPRPEDSDLIVSAVFHAPKIEQP
ncbi:hypothetical protein [Pseudarthrobacter sulfonivorans]|uniref:hypothetical protein n=1 Tax=Pseudarthrobacter sulfonivorans TaxID=121292 RepID=UPI00285E59E4|nr:hypothetical protein [Pseudarthrobacter sulfonivorans]MDR6414717.1 hypothetical protein [Pseudarthrobacter sulfonivorans]